MTCSTNRLRYMYDMATTERDLEWQCSVHLSMYQDVLMQNVADTL